MAAPLDGIRVLDLTRVLAGPFATQRLGDMGADIIKVELPGTGDDTRSWGPPFKDGVAAYFFSVNRNKRSLTCDLKSDAGREIIRRLAKTCDVLVENFRPGTLERLKLGPFDEKMIVCSISGYGQKGAWRDRPSYDVIVQGESGLQDLTGFPDGPPTKAGVSVVDLVAGLNAVESILLALLHRGKTGKGQRIDVALMDSILALTTFQSQNYFFTGKKPRRLGNAHPTIVPYETFATADGFIVVGVGTDEQFAKFCEVVGLEPHAEWRTNADRVKNRDGLVPVLAKKFAERPTAHWYTSLSSRGIPCGQIRNLADTLESPELRDREMVIKVGDTRTIGLPQKLEASPGSIRRPPPKLGQHTDEILAELGYSKSDVERFRKEKAI